MSNLPEVGERRNTMCLVKRLMRKMELNLFAKYKSEILRELKGSAKTVELAFIDGTENVESSNVNINFLFHIFQA